MKSVNRTIRWPLALAAAAVATALVGGAASAAAPNPHGRSQAHRHARLDGATPPRAPVSLHGTLERAPHGPGLVLVASAGSYRVHGGPPWYLARLFSAEIGQSVTVVGRVGGRQIQAQTVDGVAIRPGPGRPPWAGARRA